MFSTFTKSDIERMNVGSTDIKIMVAADTAEAVPTNSDKVEIAGLSYSFDEVIPFQPGGEVLYWVCKASKG
jgi:hypothetical protein